MKSKLANNPRKLASLIHLARIALAKAESKLEPVREQARAAKRRRKEAKQIARRARKQLKQAKADVADAKRALFEAEEKFARAGARSSRTRRPAKAKPVAKAAIATRRKKSAQPRKIRRRPSVAPAAAARKKRKKPAPRRVRPASGTGLTLTIRTKPVTVPRDFETPLSATAPSSATQSTLPESRAAEESEGAGQQPVKPAGASPEENQAH